MRKALILSFLAALMLATACKKDPQEKLCDGVICNNGGECVNGACDCPPEWTGPSCAQEVAPIKMRVTKIKLTDYPLTDSGGAGWDLLDGPDVYLAILKNGVSLFETGYVEDLTTQYEWTVNYEFSDPTATYAIRAYDYDDGLSSDDFLGGISFTPYISGAGFPASYVVSCTGCVVEFQFTGVSYFH
jgi:hypothetical protein